MLPTTDRLHQPDENQQQLEEPTSIIDVCHEMEEHTVAFGSATELTKGSGGRSSETAHPMP